jgi:hypothetical protein
MKNCIQNPNLLPEKKIKLKKEFNLSLKRVRKTAKVIEDTNSIQVETEEKEKLKGPFAIVVDGIVNHDRALEFVGNHTVELIHPQLLDSLIEKKVEVIWDNLKKDYYRVSEHLVLFPAEGGNF